ncbi:hypothetical protein [Motiliproteus sp.]|uniref:hypothetical protein n=1 Tax=Motiliproteus sp. TaxID=1898955 RepID=UPI003BAB361D
MFKTLTAFCCVLMLGLTLAPDAAEAKRLGGGGSFGKSFFTPKKTTPKSDPAPTAAPKQAGTTTTAAKPKPAMGGMLGGYWLVVCWPRCFSAAPLTAFRSWMC